MKKYFTSKPEELKEGWPGEFTGIEGTWHHGVTGLPSPLFVVTGWKSNGKENACLQSTAAFSGSYGEYTCILGWVNTNGHMYKSLKETGCDLWEHKLTPNNPSLVAVALKTVGIYVDKKYYTEKDKKGWLAWI